MPIQAEQRSDRSARAERSDERIRLAALNTFCERGFAETRIEDVAARAGVAKGTVLIHFPSKEALFAAVINDALDASIGRLSAAAALEGDPPTRLATLAAAVRQELRFPHHGALAWLAIRDAGRCPVLAQRLDQEWRLRSRRLVAKVIAEGIAGKQFRPCDPERIADLVIDPMVLQAIWWHAVSRHDASVVAEGSEEAFLCHLQAVIRLLRAGESPVD